MATKSDESATREKQITPKTEAEIRALIESRIAVRRDVLNHPTGHRNGPRNELERAKAEAVLASLTSILDYMDGV